MRSRRTALRIAGAVVVLLIVAIAVPLWPAGAGGSTTYIATRGASMQPKLERGDLAVLRKTDSYQVGDVAGYRNRALDRVVLHRIVEIDGDSFTFKGDANSFLDPQQVAREDVVGELAVTLPFLGAVLLWLSSLVNVLLLTVAAVLVGVAAQRRRTAPQADREPALLESPRVVVIHDMAFPHELPIADVADAEGLLALAERYDRPVLHDEEHGLLFVIEPTMLFRCQLDRAPGAALAVVREIPPPEAAKSRGRVRRPSPRGRGWDYGAEGRETS